MRAKYLRADCGTRADRSCLKARRIEIITDILQSKLIIMEYAIEPSFKNAAWKEKKAENKGARQGRHKNKDKEEGELGKKSDKHEKCRFG